MKSLKAQGHTLAAAQQQQHVLAHTSLVPFQQKLEESGLFPLRPAGIHTFQVNLGKMCNQTCRHCHVDAGPTAKK
jgi:uncharacterized Fe-S cluster-containing radical SAM superfamily enzyme